MTKNSIGQFIAALRKANGMTQQEVADRLNVSNKAVSRWERDECAPDLMLIPSLAEMFDVTCDELLKGERILDSSTQEKKEPKIQKQIKNLINRTLYSFKTLIYISLAVSVAALVCMFGISYGFYRPSIGFAIMILFEIIAFIIAILAVNRTKAVKTDNELLEEADNLLIAKFNNTLGSFSFTAFFAIASVVFLSLPLVLVTSDYVESVITIQSYFTSFFIGIALIMIFAFLKCRKPYIEWITDSRSPKSSVTRKVRIMNAVQIGLIVISGLILTVSPYFETAPESESALLYFAGITVYVCFAAVVVFFAAFLLKGKEGRQEFILPGIRNIFLMPAALIFPNIHISWWSYVDDNDMSQLERLDTWQPEYFWYTIVFTVFVLVIFSIIDVLLKRKKKNHKSS